MKNSNIVLLIVLISSSFVSCKKERLTKATQNGANTFSCKIDGKVFVAKDVYSVPTTPGILATFDRNTKKFGLYTSEPRNESKNGLSRNVQIEIYDPRVGSIIVNNNTGEIVVSEYDQLDKYFRTDNILGGSIIISKLDTSAHVISGSFSFRATQTTNSNSILQITDGRFDITYK